MNRPKAKVAHYDHMPAVLFGDEAPGTSVRQLISQKQDGAPVYDMRMIEIEPEGHTPHHTHPYEHENFIVEGQGEVFIEGEWHELGPGDVVFVPPGVQHQYRNTGDTVFRFLCSVPVENLRPTG
jgi:quercetin dioxygenase-like cupin family protein